MEVQKGNPDIPLPSNTLQLLLGDPNVFPGQKEYKIPPVSSGCAPGPPPSWTCPEKPPKGGEQVAS